MVKRIGFWFSVLALCFLTGCALPTVEQMYCLPKRPESYNDIQSVMDAAMTDMDYCAPRSGENRQTVQMADLDGDGVREYLLFARGNADRSLRILVFAQEADSYCLVDTLECSGISFDTVEYVQMDASGGVELVVGCLLNEQVQGVAAVYSFENLEHRLLLSVAYTEFLAVDLDCDDCGELLILHPGEGTTGSAELYQLRDGRMERRRQQYLSTQVENLRRIITGKLSDGAQAVFVGSAREDGMLLTDIFTLSDGEFIHVNPGNTAVAPVEGYSVYPVDIDRDGTVELPETISVKPLQEGDGNEQYLIRWYSVSTEGEITEKLHTCCNFADGWCLELDPAWSERIRAVRDGEAFRFYLWDEAFETAQEVFSVIRLTGKDREQLALENNRFVVYKDETVVYAARLEVASGVLNIGQEDLINGFHRIWKAWKTGEI